YALQRQGQATKVRAAKIVTGALPRDAPSQVRGERLERGDADRALEAGLADAPRAHAGHALDGPPVIERAEHRVHLDLERLAAMPGDPRRRDAVAPPPRRHAVPDDRDRRADACDAAR